jgi:hypothetical protein
MEHNTAFNIAGISTIVLPKGLTASKLFFYPCTAQLNISFPNGFYCTLKIKFIIINFIIKFQNETINEEATDSDCTSYTSSSSVPFTK